MVNVDLYSAIITKVSNSSILYRFQDMAGYLSKVADFDPPYLHLVPS